MPKAKTMDDFTDKQLADMVRNSIYAKNTSFGGGDNDCRFLLVLAVSYGRDEDVDSLEEAIDGFARLLTDDDWKDREFQVYDHADRRFYTSTMEEAENLGTACSDCEEMVDPDAPYFATPCGTYCETCFEGRHVGTCDICRNEFELPLPDGDENAK